MRKYALFSGFLIQFLIVQLAATLDAARVGGVVRDPDGRAVPGARVVVTSARPGAHEAVTDADGRFEIDDLPEGRQHLHVMMDGFSSEPQVVTGTADSAHQLEITLRLSALAETLVVSAAQVDVPLSQAASSVSIVTREEIAARQVRTAADALRTVPGLAIAQNGTLGSLASLFTRGGESDFTLVLVDGLRANSFGGGLDLSVVPLVDVERVEIVRGPQSAVFGSDAIGGVVQIVTGRCSTASPCDRVEAALEGGSLGSVRGRASTAGRRTRFSWSAYAEDARSDGFTGVAPATGETVGNDDGHVQHAGGSLGWRGDSGSEVLGRAQFSRTDRGFPGAFGSNPIGAYTAVDRISRGETNRRQFAALWTQPWGLASSRARQRTEASFSDFDSNFLSPFGESESDTRRLTFRTQTDAAITDTVGVSAGLEVLRERGGSTFITGETFDPIPVKRLAAGYFGEARLAPTARLSVAGGVRVEQIRRDAIEGNPSVFSPRPPFPAESIVSVNPRLSAAYLLGVAGARSTRIRASAGTGIRPPDAFEIAFTDNPQLKPERSRSVDAGIQQTFGRGGAVLDATVFFNEYDDLIVSVGRSLRDASRYRTDNISNARSRGVELAGGLRPIARLDLRASYTLLDTEILAVDRGSQAPAPYRVGERLIRRPRHRGSFTAVYAGARATAFAELAARGAVRDVEPTFGASGGVFDADGFAVLDVGGAFRVTRRVELFGRIENVADRAYEEAFGYPAPGRLVLAGVRLAAGR